MTAPHLAEPPGTPWTGSAPADDAPPTGGEVRDVPAPAPVGFAFYDTAGRYVVVNDVLARANRRTPAEHVGKTMPELLGDAGRAMDEHLSRVLRTGTALTGLEMTGRGPDGPQTWLVSWYPVRGEDGRLLGVAVLAVDATTQVATGNELRRLQARYRAVLDSADLDVLHAAGDGALDEDMPRWRRITGQTRSQLAGAGWLDAVHPDDRTRVAGAWAAAVADHGTFAEEVRIVAADGGERIVALHAGPVQVGDRPVEWVGVSRDVTADRQAEIGRRALADQVQAAAGRTERLHRVAADLAAALTVDEVATVVLAQGGDALDASGRGVALVTEDRAVLRHAALLGYPPDLAATWNEVHMGATNPLAETVRVGVPFFLGSRDDLRERWPVPEVEAFAQISGEKAWAMLPLRTTGEAFGALTFGFRQPRTLDADERTFLLTLADLCAQAIERAHLVEQVLAEAQSGQRAGDTVRAAEAAAREANRRLDVLARVSQAVNAEPEPAAALRALTAVVVADLAAVCSVQLVGAGVGPDGLPPLRVIATTVRPEYGAAPYAFPAPPAAEGPLAAALRTGGTQLGFAYEGEWLGAGTTDWVEAAGLQTAAAVPLLRGDEVAGVLVLLAAPEQAPYDESDLPFLTELAGRAAGAVDRAEMHRRGRETALTLQRSLLPATGPAGGDLEIAARYIPGSDEQDVGGDWYDVIDLGAGRTGLVIGDVAGRGVQAAAAMGQLRAAVRTCARIDLPPAEVLTLLDGLVADIAPGRQATCVYGVYETHTGLLTLADAGHPPPLVVQPDGLVSRLYLETGSPLGSPEEKQYKEYAVRLAPGSILALFTAGLVGGDQGTDAGVAALARVLAGQRGTLDLRADDVLGSLGRAGGPDDVALLLVRLPRTASGSLRATTLDLTGGAAGLSAFRGRAAEVLRRWDVGGDIAESAILVLSELTANALLHGAEPIAARVRRGASRLVVEVADAAPQLPRRRYADPDDEYGRGLELVAGLAGRWGVRSTGGGKIVWAELDLPSAAPAARAVPDGAADDAAARRARADLSAATRRPMVPPPAEVPAQPERPNGQPRASYPGFDWREIDRAMAGERQRAAAGGTGGTANGNGAHPDPYDEAVDTAPRPVADPVEYGGDPRYVDGASAYDPAPEVDETRPEPWNPPAAGPPYA